MSSGRNTTSDAAALPAFRSPSSPSNDQDDPFAPPPEGAPDRPWRPRTPPARDRDRLGGPGSGGASGGGSGSGSGPESGSGDGGNGGGGGDEGGGDRGPWGSPWDGRQPGPQRGGFGGRPGGGQGGPLGPKFDVTDPVQRRARYALLSGMWALFFGLFSMPQIALLLGALALYWGASALRAQPRGADPSRGGGTGAGDARPQAAAAKSGIIAGGVALAIVLANFAVQMAYKDYFTCVSDALTSKARVSCKSELPEWLHGVYGVKE